MVQYCPTCSGGANVGYVGASSGYLQFNGVTASMTGSYTLRIDYANGDAVRIGFLSVNGGQGRQISFPSTGGFSTVGSLQTTVTLNQGNNNTLRFYNPNTGHWAPDFDRIGVNCRPAPPTDFNSDGKPDYLLYNLETRQIAVWYLNNNIHIGGAYGNTLPDGFRVIDAADFNRDGRSDFALFNASTGQTRIWYLSGVNGITLIGSASGPRLPHGWELVGSGDFNNNGKPDYLIFNVSTRQTAIWYLNNNVFLAEAFGPNIPRPWKLVGSADFNRDGKRDYLLFNPNTQASVIWYLSGTLRRIGSAAGPPITAGSNLSGVADFNRDGKPDYLLLNASSNETAIWYLNNNLHIGTAVGPTLPPGYTLAAP
jgi:hypothetical protein